MALPLIKTNVTPDKDTKSFLSIIFSWTAKILILMFHESLHLSNQGQETVSQWVQFPGMLLFHHLSYSPVIQKWHLFSPPLSSVLHFHKLFFIFYLLSKKCIKVPDELLCLDVGKMWTFFFFSILKSYPFPALFHTCAHYEGVRSPFSGRLEQTN